MAHDFVDNLLKAFIPMFVAVDIIGVIPFFISVTDGMKKEDRSRLILQSVITALCIAVAFVFAGDALFGFLHIEIFDFMIAGGIVLFLLSANEMLTGRKAKVDPDTTAGVVPLGTPLLAGPAVLTTALILIKQNGLVATLIAIVANLAIAGLAFHFSRVIIKALGKNGARAFSKIMALVLSAYGVMMIRLGILQIIKHYSL